ncbi:MAG: hypothetical protein ACNA75_12300, partial [Thiohalomonadaceae bacterium]
ETVGACPGGSTAASDTSPCIAVVTGAKFPTASTQRGTVSSEFPEAACDQAAAQTIATDFASR